MGPGSRDAEYVFSVGPGTPTHMHATPWMSQQLGLDSSAILQLPWDALLSPIVSCTLIQTGLSADSTSHSLCPSHWLGLPDSPVANPQTSISLQYPAKAYVHFESQLPTSYPTH